MEISIVDFPVRTPRDAALSSQRARLLGLLAGLSTRARRQFGKAVADVIAAVVRASGSGSVRLGLTRRATRQCIAASISCGAPPSRELEAVLAQLRPAAADSSDASGGPPGETAILDVTEGTSDRVTVTVSWPLAAGTDRIEAADVTEWATILASRTTHGALVSAQRQLHELAENLASGEERESELQAQAQQLTAAQEMHQLLALVASKTDNSVVITDHEGRIEWVNDGFSSLTGYELSEVRGQRMDRVLCGPQTDAGTLREVQQALRLGHGLSRELLRYKKSGQPYWELVARLEGAGGGRQPRQSRPRDAHTDQARP